MYTDYKQIDNKNYNFDYNLLIECPETGCLTKVAEILNIYLQEQNNSCGNSMNISLSNMKIITL